MMDKAKEIRKGEALNWDKLENYLVSQIPEMSGSMKVAQFHGGHANLTYLLTFGDKELILRRPPFGKIAPGAHDMGREYKVLSKLYKYYKPAPRAYHHCIDDSIIGAQFVIVERRNGVVVRTEMLDCFKAMDNPEERIANAMIRAQADLHLVDYQAADLSNLGRPKGFLERQIAGWTKRWNWAKTEDNKDVDDIIAWLSQDIPKSQRVSIIHNDIKPDNCQFQPNNPDVVTALFDWDMCTLGDPLMDFASTLSYWPDDRISSESSKNLPASLKGNFPPKEHLIKKYEDYTGFDLSQLQWYEVFSFWKSAVIAQQLYKRYVDGETTDERMGRFGESARVIIELARKIVFEG